MKIPATTAARLRALEEAKAARKSADGRIIQRIAAASSQEVKKGTAEKAATDEAYKVAKAAYKLAREPYKDAKKSYKAAKKARKAARESKKDSKKVQNAAIEAHGVYTKNIQRGPPPTLFEDHFDL